ncbi:response regulator [Gallaecimonas mangrovi]|uniref:response regulator n=1 Tax=Gallaecimonas mangrovi TaxID=2291597 RepID=UPI000E20B751|nr:two-component system response regulator [Gallaecimonas mangrovi]
MDNAQYTILIVDDTPANIDVAKEVLKESYNVQAAINATLALKIIERKAPDLILLDVMMPDVDGYQLCQQLKADPNTQAIPVIFLTAKADIKDEAHGLALGAADYITKPLSPPILLARVKNHLALAQARKALEQQNQQLEDKVRERTHQLAELQDVAMVSMGALAEARDPETGNHIRRTQHYVQLLATELAKKPQYAVELTPENITMLFKSAPLHDIGKVGVPDHILLKPGKLTDAEFAEMKKHPGYGRDALNAAIGTLNEANNFLRYAMEIAYGHHEKWDGSGYPQGLKGEDIPLSARLMAIADVYDALISVRVYKPAFPHAKAIAIMQEGRGSHFDPSIFDTFISIADQFYEVSKTYADTELDFKRSALS